MNGNVDKVIPQLSTAVEKDRREEETSEHRDVSNIMQCVGTVEEMVDGTKGKERGDESKPKKITDNGNELPLLNENYQSDKEEAITSTVVEKNESGA